MMRTEFDFLASDAVECWLEPLKCVGKGSKCHRMIASEASCSKS